MGEGIFFGAKHGHSGGRVLYGRPDRHDEPAQLLKLSRQKNLKNHNIDLWFPKEQKIGLLALGVIGLLVAVWWFVWPWVRESGKARQPAPVVSTGPTTGSPVTPGISSSAKQAPDANSPEEKERQAQERLKQQASEFVVMVGTFSQADEFDALREAGLQTTKDLHGFLSKQRATLMAAHSRFGPSWGQTTRAISARLISGTPLLSSSEVMVQGRGKWVYQWRQKNIV